MKKLITMILALALALPLSVTAFADEAVVTTSIASIYLVTIPKDVTVEFSETSTDFGSIALTVAKLDPGYAVQVTVESGGELVNQADESKTIPYTINDAEGVFTSGQYWAAGDSTPLTIGITQEDWDAAYAGEYSDTVTFTISYEKAS